jgi:hypothetical protein
VATPEVVEPEEIGPDEKIVSRKFDEDAVVEILMRLVEADGNTVTAASACAHAGIEVDDSTLRRMRAAYPNRLARLGGQPVAAA